MADIIKFKKIEDDERENIINILMKDILNFLEGMDKQGSSIRDCIDGIHRAILWSKKGTKYEVNPK